jgi:hypothetical protein
MSGFLKKTIPFLPDEYWWGGRVLDAQDMPCHQKTVVSRELSTNLGGNQACPFLVSNQGRYLWGETPFGFEFKNGQINITSRSPIIFEQGLGNLRETFLYASQKHFPASGKYPDLKNFTAPQYNTWITMKKDPSQEKVLAFANSILDQGLPPGVIIIDDWWYERLGDFRFHSKKFPDPQKMIKELHHLGFLVYIWVSPFIARDSFNFSKLHSTGLLVKETNSLEAAEIQWWNGSTPSLDLSNPESQVWLKHKLILFKKKYGLDGFKFDGGDPEHYKNTLAYHQKKPAALHTQAFGEIGLNFNNSEYRACWNLGGKHLIQRIRDKNHCWEQTGLADLVPAGIALGLMGHRFSCPDMIGGGELSSFDSKQFMFDQELFIRWLQVSVFFPIMQYSLLPQQVLDNKHFKYCQAAHKTRKKICHYLLQLVKSTAKNRRANHSPHGIQLSFSRFCNH